MSVPSSPPVPLGQARAAAARLLGRLERSDEAIRLAVTGDVRRMAPWVARVDLLATAHAAAPLLDDAAAAGSVGEVLSRTATVLELRLKDGVHVRLEALEEEPRFGAALARRTGPERYVAALQEHAGRRGLAWEGDRLLRNGVEQACPEESDVFALLGLPWCPPERRGTAPVTAAPPPDLVAMDHLAGVAGLHTSAGAGRYTLLEMATRAAREGYKWALAFATQAECDAWTPDPDAPLSLVPAYEVRFDAEGRLALPEGSESAWVVAAPAEALAPEPLAHAVLAVARDARVDVLLLRMPAAGGPRLDVARLLDAALSGGAALAIPPPPHHPEPEPLLLGAAAARGVPMLLCADAHDLVSLDDAALVVGLARRGGVPQKLVLNALSRADLSAWRIARRARHGLPA